MNRLIVSFFALPIVGLMGSLARASIVYQYIADISSVTGAPGSTTAVNIFLQQTASGVSPDLILARNGLRSAGFKLARPGTAVDGGATITGAVDQTGAGGNFAGGTGFTPVAFPTVSFANKETVSAAAVSGALGTPNGAVRTVLLGTLSLTVGSVGSTFTLGARDLSNTNTTFFTPDATGGGVNGLDLDSNSEPPFLGASDFTFSIQVNPIPEPGAASLLALGGLLLAARRRRDRVDR